MEGDFIKINEWLTPLSWLYGIGVGIRNQMFELGILKSKAFDVPVISVGNITVGGSGKTPHVEYLIRQLHDKVKVAVLSRGYKRKSRGYVLADEADGVLKFHLSSPLNRAARMWEDTITLSPILGGWEVEGLTRDLVRVIGSVEQYFRNHGKD